MQNTGDIQADCQHQSRGASERKHRRGSKMLMPLAKRGINLSKIESRPSKKRPWDYYFFIDVTGHYGDQAMREAVKRLRSFCPMVKWLGSYPAAS